METHVILYYTYFVVCQKLYLLEEKKNVYTKAFYMSRYYIYFLTPWNPILIIFITALYNYICRPTKFHADKING